MQTQVFFTALFGYVLLRERAGPPLQSACFWPPLGLACFSANYLAPHAGTHVTRHWALHSTWRGVHVGGVQHRRAQGAAGQRGIRPAGLRGLVQRVPVLPFLALTSPSTILPRAGTGPRPRGGLGGVAYLGWMATIVAYGLWTSLIKRHGANRVAPFSLGVGGRAWRAGFCAGRDDHGWQWGGIALVIAALACVMFGGRWSA